MSNILPDWMFTQTFLKWFLIGSTISMFAIIIISLAYIGHWIGLY